MFNSFPFSTKVNVSKPFAEWLDFVLGNSCYNILVTPSGKVVLFVKPDFLFDVLFFLKSCCNCKFDILSDICGVDYPSKKNRFELNYQLLSYRFNLYISVKSYASQNIGVDSSCSLFGNANWFEREVFDLFGVFFKSHPDLRRILTDYGFEGYPMRKDFPLSGFTEVRYDFEKKRVVSEPLSLSQEFKAFSFNTSNNTNKPFFDIIRKFLFS